MDLIIGGAYQGKLDYAREHFGIEEQDICICTEQERPDFEKRCLVHYEKYLLYCLRSKEEKQLPRQDAVVIAEDIFCGVVPIDPEIRAWREEAGRGLTALAHSADTVTRIFCGLPLKLK